MALSTHLILNYSVLYSNNTVVDSDPNKRDYSSNTLDHTV